jgi:hypothetical protein
MQQNDSIVYGQVVLISPSGTDLTKLEQVTTRNIQSLLPSQETLKKAKLGLQQLGFSINVQGVSISISGKKKTLKKYFLSN